MEFKEFTEKHHWYTSFWADVVWILLGALALLFVFGTQYATGQFGYYAWLEKNSVRPNEPVIVNFNRPVSPTAVEKNFTISPSAKIEFSWSNNNRTLVLKPASPFQEGQAYEVKIDPRGFFSVEKIFGKSTDPTSLSFQVEIPPKAISMTPENGASNVKIDSAVRVSFDKTTKGYDVKFIVEPFSSFDLSYDELRKDFVILPKGKLDYARDYVIEVRMSPSAENLPTEKMAKIFRANFKTESSPPPPPEPVQEVVLPETNENGEVNLPYVATTEAKIAEGKYIDINLKKQQLSIFENGERLGTYKVSTGKRGMATPTGTFKVMSKAGRAYSKKYKLYMPYWMQFTGAGHGIHELPEWKNGYKEGANHLGIPVSHGCVRLGVGPAAKVYGWSETGTPIVIHY